MRYKAVNPIGMTPIISKKAIEPNVLRNLG